jgi:hypothetical protein
MRYRSCLTILLLVACHEGSGPAPSSTGSRDVVKQTVSELRHSPRLRIQIRLPDAAAASAGDLKLRRAMEEKIEHDRVGTIVEESAGSGYIDFTVEAENSVIAIPKLKAIIREAGLADRTAVEVKQ